jgi:hypothetical protein
MTVTTLKESGIGKEIKRLSKSAPASGESQLSAETPFTVVSIVGCGSAVIICYVVFVLLLPAAALKKKMYLTELFLSSMDVAVRDMSSNIANKWRALISSAGVQAPSVAKTITEGGSCQSVVPHSFR